MQIFINFMKFVNIYIKIKFSLNLIKMKLIQSKKKLTLN